MENPFRWRHYQNLLNVRTQASSAANRKGRFMPCQLLSLFAGALPNPANLFLGEAGVAVFPVCSARQNGDGYLRLCCAYSIETISKALERMESVLRRR